MARYQDNIRRKSSKERRLEHHGRVTFTFSHSYITNSQDLSDRNHFPIIIHSHMAIFVPKLLNTVKEKVSNVPDF